MFLLYHPIHSHYHGIHTNNELQNFEDDPDNLCLRLSEKMCGPLVVPGPVPTDEIMESQENEVGESESGEGGGGTAAAGAAGKAAGKEPGEYGRFIYKEGWPRFSAALLEQGKKHSVHTRVRSLRKSRFFSIEKVSDLEEGFSLGGWKIIGH